MQRIRLARFLVSLTLLSPLTAPAADLSRLVRLKLSAGDLASGEAAVEEYKRTKGVDPDYLDAVGWLARGSVLLGKADRADRYVAELHREIPKEKDDVIVPYGAAIEVEGKLKATREGRGPAVQFLQFELARAKDVSLRSRIRKNINLLTMEGQPVPDVAGTEHLGAAVPKMADLRGKPVLLFLWAHDCGDCKAQAPILARVLAKYKDKGLTMIAPTRYYGENSEWKPAPPAEEKVAIQKSWDSFEGFEGVSAPIDAETMVRFGVSATPTLVLVDRKGIVRLYTPTRMSESELSRRIEEILAEAG